MKIKFTYLLNIILILGLSITTQAANITYKITGISGIALHNVQSRLDNANSNLSAQPNVDELNHFANDRILKEVNLALQPYGYFQSQVEIISIHDTPPYSINLNITPGQPVILHKVEIVITGEGKNSEAFRRLQQHADIQVGQPMNSNKYELLKTAFFDLAANTGYFKAKMLKSEIQVNLITHEAFAIIHFDTGPRYRIGTVTYSGSKLSDNFLRRFQPFKEGEYYSAQKIQRLQSNLSGSGYFQTVSVTPAPEQSKNFYIPIDVSTSPIDSQQYTFGIGYGTDTGIRGLAAVNFRRLGKKGQHADAILRASQIVQNLSFNYYIPGKNPVKSQYVLSAVGENYNQKITTSNNTQISNDSVPQQPRNTAKLFRTSARYDTHLDGWKQSIALNLLFEHFQLNGQPKQKTFITYPSANWYKAFWTDNKTSPTRGVSLTINISGAVKKALSERSYFRAITTLRTLYTWHDAWRFIGRAQIGEIATQDINALPYSLQFYTGGADDLRGFRYNSIGPGHHLLVSSAELQRKIASNWYIEWFYDIGNVSDKYYGQMNQGTGPGLVWHSPIGSFELTLANILVPKGGAKRRIQFSFGTDL